MRCEDVHGRPPDEPTYRRRDLLRGVGLLVGGTVGTVGLTEPSRAGSVTGGCLAAWPPPLADRLDVSGTEAVVDGSLPDSGDLVLYVHGLFGEDIHEALDEGNGANQAAALAQALTEELGSTALQVIPVMWNSTATYTLAKWRATAAGETLADWLEDNAGDYRSVRLLAHSLGARVALHALERLETVTLHSVGLLGGGVSPRAICDTYADGISAHATAVYNYRSTFDEVACLAYAVREGTAALGCVGPDCGSVSDSPPANFTDVDVSGSVIQHCNYFKPESMDFPGENSIPELVDRQF